MYLFAWHSFCCDMEGDILMRKKTLTKTQHMENYTKVLNLAARLIACTFLLAVIIYSLPLHI